MTTQPISVTIGAVVSGSQPEGTVRCWRCGKLLAHSARDYNITCPRCHARNQG